MRRIPNEPDATYSPANELELRICEEVQRHTNEEIIAIWTQETYPVHDERENQIKIAHEYVVKTGARHKKHFFNGHEFGVDIVDDKISLTHLATWFS